MGLRLHSAVLEGLKFTAQQPYQAAPGNLTPLASVGTGSHMHETTQIYTHNLKLFKKILKHMHRLNSIFIYTEGGFFAVLTKCP